MQDALDALDQHLLLWGDLVVHAADDDCLGGDQCLAKRLESLLAQSATGGHHVGDGIGHAKPDGDLHRTVQADDLGINPPLVEVAAHQVRVAGGDALALQRLDAPLLLLRCGVAEGGIPEAQFQQLLDLFAGVRSQVAAGDAHVQVAGSHVDRDVLRAQEVELHPVCLVLHSQGLGIAAGGIACLFEDLGGGFGERTLVWNGDAKHDEFPLRESEGWSGAAPRGKWTVGTKP